MQDSKDSVMALWLSLPNEAESIIEHKLKDKMAQFRLVQPSMRGYAKGDEDTKIPFMCMKVFIQESNPGSRLIRGPRIINAFREGNKWSVSLVEGDKPSFDAHPKSEHFLKGLDDLVKHGSMDLPYMHMQTMTLDE